MMEFVAAPPPPLEEHTIRSRQEWRQTPPTGLTREISGSAIGPVGVGWMLALPLAGFASIAASFAAEFKISLISRLRSRPMMINVALQGLPCGAFSP